MFYPQNKAPGESLAQVAQEVTVCPKCRLFKTRTKAVPGEGNPSAKIVFVGEGPGRDEDLQGKPFVGLAGQLLTKIIASIGFSREEVFITNIIKCRPPMNRNPQPDEIAACEPYLHRQLEIIRPILICALGTFAAQTLLRTDQKISALRGRFHDYPVMSESNSKISSSNLRANEGQAFSDKTRHRGILLLPTFHPAFLLRNPNMKRAVWEDVQKLRAKYDEFVNRPLD